MPHTEFARIAASIPCPTDRSPNEILEALPEAEILVAEDNDLNRLVLEAMLEGTPVSPHFVQNGEVALKTLDYRNFAMAIVDLRMPMMDGAIFKVNHDAAVRQGRHQWLPIILSSASPAFEQVAAQKRLGFHACLPKPIKLGDLAVCLWNVLQAQPIIIGETS